MNYCIVAFGIVLLIAALQWIFDGRKNFTGPRVDMDALAQGNVQDITGAEVVEVEQAGDSGSFSGKREERSD